MAPVVVMSTMSSAWPAAGAPSVAPRTLDDAVVGHVLLGEEAPGEFPVFGRDAHALAAARVEGGGDILEVRHRPHVDPGLRYGDDDIGVAEAERRQQFQLAICGLDLLADEVLAGDPHVDLSGGKQADDLGGRDIGDLDAVDAFERAAIIAGAAPLRELQPGAGEEGHRVFLQPSLGWDRENEAAHDDASATRRSPQSAAPTAGTSEVAPSAVSRRS